MEKPNQLVGQRSGSPYHTLQMLCVQPVWQLDAALLPLVQVDRHPQRHHHRKVGLEGTIVTLHRM